MRTCKMNCRAWPALFLLACLMPLLAVAQDGSWRVRRDQLLAEVNAQILAEVENEVRPEAVALANGLTWPIPPASKTLDQIYAEAEARLNEALKREFPDRLREEILQEAQRLYGYCKVGDDVSVRTIGKMSHQIQGRLQAVTPGRVRIANRWLTAVDLDRDTMARFFPEQAQEVQKRFVDREMRRLNLRLDDFARRFREGHFPDLLLQHGYRPLEMVEGPEFLVPANWLSQTDWFADRLYAARQAHAEQIRPEIEETVLAGQGFYYDPMAREWRPEEMRPRRAAGRSSGTGQGATDGQGVMDKLKRLFR